MHQPTNLPMKVNYLLIDQYLQDFFLEPDEEYKLLYKFWCQAIKNIPPGGTALEIGVGPTIYTTIPLAERFREIHLADYVEESMQQIQCWLNEEPTAFNWTSFIQLVLQTEGKKGTKEEIKEREQKLRQKITKLLPCDMRCVEVLGKEQNTYDLVTAHYCTDAASSNCQEWFQVVRNISRLVKPQGWLMISVGSNLNFGDFADWTYGKEPPKSAPNLTSVYIQNCLETIGIDSQSLQLEVFPASGNSPYSNNILLSVQKPANR